MSSHVELPAAGLFRTTLPHPNNPQAVRERMLVYFSPKSDQGPPIVLLPERQQGQIWSFGTKGVLVEDHAWAQSLVALRPQGYYTLAGDLIVGPGQRLPDGLLVLLTYTRAGEPVIHAGVRTPDSVIAFAREALALSDLQLDSLVPANFRLATAQIVRPNENAPGNAAPEPKA